MYQDIFRDTPAYQYITNMFAAEIQERVREEVREEVLQEQCKASRKILLAIVQARFPTLKDLVQKQARQIKNVIVLEKVIAGVGSALTLEEAEHVLITWKQTNRKSN